MQERALARAAGACNRGELPGHHFQVNALQRRGAHAFALVHFRQPHGAQNRFHGPFTFPAYATWRMASTGCRRPATQAGQRAAASAVTSVSVTVTATCAGVTAG